MTKYNEQYERIKRWYKRFHEKDQIYVLFRNPENDLDDVLSFFQNCYHLKDWLINDPSIKISCEEIEKFINKNKNLRLCADICNGSKHLKLKSPRQGYSGITKKVNYNIYVSMGSPFNTQYIVNSKNKKFDGFTLATKCLNDWERFFTKNKITFTSYEKN